MAKNQGPSGAAIGVGVGVAAAAAIAAGGAYWLYGAKHSAQHRKMAKSWMLKARSEVLEAVENIKDIDKNSYMAVVDGVLAKYAGKAGASSGELAHMMRDFKTAWGHMQQAQKSASKGVSSGKKTTKKIVRKVRKVASKR